MSEELKKEELQETKQPSAKGKSAFAAVLRFLAGAVVFVGVCVFFKCAKYETEVAIVALFGGAFFALVMSVAAIVVDACHKYLNS